MHRKVWSFNPYLLEKNFKPIILHDIGQKDILIKINLSFIITKDQINLTPINWPNMNG